MDTKQILENLGDLISDLESLINEADNENPDQSFLDDLDLGLQYLQEAYERKNQEESSSKKKQKK